MPYSATGRPAPRTPPRLQLTKQILTETLRLWPAMLLFTRLVTRDASLGGQGLPAGTILLSSAALAHYQDDMHSEPTRFDPHRRDPGSPRPPREGFLPFNTGARKCIGDQYGFTEAVLTLATIAARWNLLPLSGAPPVRPARAGIPFPRPLFLRAAARVPADPQAPIKQAPSGPS